jgi:agmatine/peptidylarginine deiminase
VTIIDPTTRAAIGDRLPADHLIEGNLPDVWIRDFGAVPVAGELVQFVYRPAYHRPAFSDEVAAGWAGWLDEASIPVRKVDLVLDGGNIVYNRAGDAIITERVLQDNPGRSREGIRRQLLDEAGLARVAIVPEGPREKTGHADGLASWIAPDVIGLGRMGEPFQSRISESLRAQLPGVTLVPVPHTPTGVCWQGWQSCGGIYANSLVTRNAHYVPQFGLEADSEAVAIYRRHADRPVIPVQTGSEVELGGTIRCLTMEVEGPIAERILGLRFSQEDKERSIS